MTTHILSVLVENRPGVLARVAGLFARRGFNIDSLAVGEAEDRTRSRMTIVVTVDNKPLEQITKQLHKLINVLRITELAHEDAVERELVLFKLRVDGGRRAEVLELADIFRAKVVDVDADAVVLEATGSPDKVLALEKLVRPWLIEVARTGRVALARGASGLKAPGLHKIAL